MMFSKNESLKVKGIAILLLFFHHLFYKLTRFQPYGLRVFILSQEKLIELAVICRICVWIFVFITALGITILYNKKSNDEKISDFIIKRWLSLMKGYWIIFLVIFLLELGMNDCFNNIYHGSITNLFLDFMGWADLFKTPTLTGGWWYMSFAQITVFIMPLFIEFCKKYGNISIIIFFIVWKYLNIGIVSPFGGRYINYFISIIIGILCVQNGFFEKFNFQKSNFINLLRFCFLIVLIVILLQIRSLITINNATFDNNNLQYLINGVIVIIICLISFGYLKGIVANLLAFFGKHSGNMFLIHIFLVNNFPKIIYYTKTVLGSFFTLFIICILCSIFIEHIKKKITYNELIDKVFSFILK